MDCGEKSVHAFFQGLTNHWIKDMSGTTTWKHNRPLLDLYKLFLFYGIYLLGKVFI